MPITDLAVGSCRATPRESRRRAVVMSASAIPAELANRHGRRVLRPSWFREGRLVVNLRLRPSAPKACVCQCAVRLRPRPLACRPDVMAKASRRPKELAKVAGASRPRPGGSHILLLEALAASVDLMPWPAPDPKPAEATVSGDRRQWKARLVSPKLINARFLCVGAARLQVHDECAGRVRGRHATARPTALRLYFTPPGT
jgi:hypothetical protein